MHCVDNCKFLKIKLSRCGFYRRFYCKKYKKRLKSEKHYGRDKEIRYSWGEPVAVWSNPYLVSESPIILGDCGKDRVLDRVLESWRPFIIKSLKSEIDRSPVINFMKYENERLRLKAKLIKLIYRKLCADFRVDLPEFTDPYKDDNYLNNVVHFLWGFPWC